MNGVLNPASAESFPAILARLLESGSDGVLHLMDAVTGGKAVVRILDGRVSEAVIGTSEGDEALTSMAELDGWWYRFQPVPLPDAKNPAGGALSPLASATAKAKPAGAPTVAMSPVPEAKPVATNREGWVRFVSINGELSGSGISREDLNFYRDDIHFFREQARRIGASLGLFGPRVMAMVEPDRVSTMYVEETPWILRGQLAPGGVGLSRLLAAQATPN